MRFIIDDKVEKIESLVMTEPRESVSSLSLFEKISELFNLRNDTDEAGTIEAIKKNVDFKNVIKGLIKI